MECRRQLRRLRAGLTLFLAAFAIPIVAQPITAEQRQEVLDGMRTLISTRAFVPGADFSRWEQFLEQRQAAIEAAETIPEFARVVNTALRQFGMSHISLRTPSQAAARVRTHVVGIGVSVQPTEEGLRVTNVLANSPAQELGIRAGDLIVSVAGERPSSPEALDGEEGTEVTVKVRREDGEMDMTVQRRRISVRREDTLTWPERNVAMLRIHSFSAGYEQERILKHMEVAANADALILDLRSNGGGAVNNMNQLLSLLMPVGTEYGTFINRRLADQFREATGNEPNDPFEIAKWAPSRSRTTRRAIEPFKGKIVVLINRGSASASEIVACALREHRGAVLIGQRTAGAVLASTFGRLPHNFQLQYPVSDYVSSGGVRIERNPLVPDIEAAMPRPGEDADEGLEKALEWIREQLAKG